MRNGFWLGALTGLAAFLLVLLWVSRPPRMHIVDAQPASSAQMASVSADSESSPAAAEAATDTPTPTPTPTSIFEGFTGWRGEYFDNPNLSGNPVLVRDDPNINFYWGSGSPATGLPADNFSVRWERIVTFDEDSVYRFSLHKNDGARVWYDDRLIFDLWEDDNSRAYYYAQLPVIAGSHTFRVEYREGEGSANIRFGWQRWGAIQTATPTPTPTMTATPQPPLEEFNGWRGEYFENTGLRGDPALVRDDADIDFRWSGSPADGVPANYFSVRWERIVSFDGGLYSFVVERDDAARVWVNGQLLIDAWRSRYYNDSIRISRTATLAAGAHTIRVDYYDSASGARIKFWWEQLTATSTPTPTPTPTPTAYARPPLEKNNRWRVEYYTNQLLAGIPARSESWSWSYPRLNFNWSDGAPGSGRYGIPDDHFSGRWERIVTLSGGLYRFTLEKDDGARVWVNGQLIIDHWKDCCDEGERFEADLPLIAGDHIIRVEYYEKKGMAKLQLSWDLVGPLPMLTPTPTPGAPWSATMTVRSSGGYTGYGLSVGGTLSDSDFRWRGTTYTVEAILHNPFSGTVSLEFSDDLNAERADLIFCLDATRLELAQARSPNDRQFFWDNVDPGWNDGDTVSVSLNNCSG